MCTLARYGTSPFPAEGRALPPYRGTVHITDEVNEALGAGHGIVALESTILAHGLPRGRNRKVASRLEETVRAAGAVPATIAVLDGEPRIGLTGGELDRVCTADLVKLSRRDLAPRTRRGATAPRRSRRRPRSPRRPGSACSRPAASAGSTGAPPSTFDVSADLDVLAGTPIVVVCSGVKSILDIAATLEVLETRSVPVLGYRTDDVPGVLPPRVGVPGPVDGASQRPRPPRSPARTSTRCPARAGIVLANPVPPEAEMPRALHDELLAAGLALLAERGITGHDVTPALLEHFHTASGGVSIDTNEELVVANAALAAEVAVAFAAGPA